MEYTYKRVTADEMAKNAKSFDSEFNKTKRKDNKVLLGGKAASIKVQAYNPKKGAYNPFAMNPDLANYKGMSAAAIKEHVLTNVLAEVDYDTGEINVILPKALYSKASSAALKGDIQWDVFDIIDREVQAQVRRGIERHMVEEAKEFAIATGIRPSEIRLSDGYIDHKGEERKPVAYARGWEGQVSFSERLMQYPKEYRDTTYIHEISHMTGWGDYENQKGSRKPKGAGYEGNNRKPFWDLLLDFVPDYHLIHDTYLYNVYSKEIHGLDRQPHAAKAKWATLEAEGLPSVKASNMAKTALMRRWNRWG